MSRKVHAITVLMAAFIVTGSVNLLSQDKGAAAKDVQENIVQNGGFEKWTTIDPSKKGALTPKLTNDAIPENWVPESEVGATGLVGKDASGDKNACAVIEHKEPVITSLVEWIKVKPNSTYVLRCRIKADNVVSSPKEAGAPFIWVVSGPEENYWSNQQFNPKQLKGGTYDWEPYEFTFTTNEKSEKAALKFQLRLASGKFYFDDVVITEVAQKSKSVQSF